MCEKRTLPESSQRESDRREEEQPPSKRVKRSVTSSKSVSFSDEVKESFYEIEEGNQIRPTAEARRSGSRAGSGEHQLTDEDWDAWHNRIRFKKITDNISDLIDDGAVCTALKVMFAGIYLMEKARYTTGLLWYTPVLTCKIANTITSFLREIGDDTRFAPDVTTQDRLAIANNLADILSLDFEHVSPRRLRTHNLLELCSPLLQEMNAYEADLFDDLRMDLGPSPKEKNREQDDDESTHIAESDGQGKATVNPASQENITTDSTRHSYLPIPFEIRQLKKFIGLTRAKGNDNDKGSGDELGLDQAEQELGVLQDELESEELDISEMQREVAIELDRQEKEEQDLTEIEHLLETDYESAKQQRQSAATSQYTNVQSIWQSEHYDTGPYMRAMHRSDSEISPGLMEIRAETEESVASDGMTRQDYPNQELAVSSRPQLRFIPEALDLYIDSLLGSIRDAEADTSDNKVKVSEHENTLAQLLPKSKEPSTARNTPPYASPLQARRSKPPEGESRRGSAAHLTTPLQPTEDPRVPTHNIVSSQVSGDVGPGNNEEPERETVTSSPKKRKRNRPEEGETSQQQEQQQQKQKQQTEGQVQAVTEEHADPPARNTRAQVRKRNAETQDPASGASPPTTAATSRPRRTKKARLG